MSDRHLRRSSRRYSGGHYRKENVPSSLYKRNSAYLCTVSERRPAAVVKQKRYSFRTGRKGTRLLQFASGPSHTGGVRWRLVVSRSSAGRPMMIAQVRSSLRIDRRTRRFTNAQWPSVVFSSLFERFGFVICRYKDERRTFTKSDRHTAPRAIKR